MHRRSCQFFFWRVCVRQAPSFSSQQLATSADTVSKRSIFWLVIGLGMLVLIGGIGALTLHWVDQSDYWVDHTREVISNNQRLLLDVRDAESAERGYIITGDESYLGPYEGATNDVR